MPSFFTFTVFIASFCFIEEISNNIYLTFFIILWHTIKLNHSKICMLRAKSLYTGTWPLAHTPFFFLKKIRNYHSIEKKNPFKTLKVDMYSKQLCSRRNGNKIFNLNPPFFFRLVGPFQHPYH